MAQEIDHLDICQSFDEKDLTTIFTSLDRTYYLGQTITYMPYGKTSTKTVMFVKAHTTLTIYQPYVINRANTASGEVVTAAPATMASGVTVGIPQVAITSGNYGFVVIAGNCTAALANETHVAGDNLELLNAGTTLIVNGSTGSTAFDTKSVAIQVGTLVGAGNAEVILVRGKDTSLISAS